jgi:hypothetical protein
VNPIVQFPKIVDHLTNPYAFAGFLLCIAFAVLELLFRRNFFPKLTQKQAPSVLRFIVTHGFRLAALIVIALVGYACYQVHEENKSTQTSPAIRQQTGDCGANVNGSQNQTSVDCSDGAKPK